ncbi:glycosyltransferase family 39 protein [Halobaculum sp. CBA1158]|uniref:ArnT family glycosyltransferase n=1 Tax=Halobaculum sp. CBA1158 TaxID=2904243 RepID=UPI001F1EDD77|nr:glycosyltransferase family 39 protein [Halobaculum sp. CBA1158]UIP01057.1 glycosyltransferase family 39 protein [Halobaculum sp. CBA1158]
MDEVFYAQAGISMIEGNMHGNPTHMHAPLAKYLIGASQWLFGVSEETIRAPIAMIGVASITVIYGTARYVFNRLTALVAALLLAALPEYNYYATMAMLDVPLAVVVTAAFGVTVWWYREERDGQAASILGTLSVFAGSIKVQGALYVFGLLAIVSWMALVEHRNRWRRIVRAYTVGAVLTFILVYLPFAFSPAPTYYGGATPPEIAQTIFSIPWLGSVAFAFAASIVHNLSHLDNGHRVIVLGTTYFSPPAWVLPYWIATFGGIPYLAGLVTAVIAALGRIGDRGIRIGFVGLLIGPLLIHSVLSVKLSRYLVPLYPLLALAAGYLIVKISMVVVRFVSDQRSKKLASQRRLVAVAITLLLLISIVPPSLGGATTHDSIRTDSGIGDASKDITNHASENTQATAIVVNPLPFRWYLGEHRVGKFTKNVHVPKQFAVGDRSVTLVGTKYSNIGTVLDKRRPCLVVVSTSWVDKVDEDNSVLQYIEDSIDNRDNIKRHGEFMVIDTCSGDS